MSLKGAGGMQTEMSKLRWTQTERSPSPLKQALRQVNASDAILLVETAPLSASIASSSRPVDMCQRLFSSRTLRARQVSPGHGHRGGAHLPRVHGAHQGRGIEACVPAGLCLGELLEVLLGVGAVIWMIGVRQATPHVAQQARDQRGKPKSTQSESQSLPI